LPFPQLQNFRKNNKTLGWKTPLNVEGVKKGAGGWENGLGKAGSTCAPSQTHTQFQMPITPSFPWHFSSPIPIFVCKFELPNSRRYA